MEQKQSARHTPWYVQQGLDRSRTVLLLVHRADYKAHSTYSACNIAGWWSFITLWAWRCPIHSEARYHLLFASSFYSCCPTFGCELFFLPVVSILVKKYVTCSCRRILAVLWPSTTSHNCSQKPGTKLFSHKISFWFCQIKLASILSILMLSQFHRTLQVLMIILMKSWNQIVKRIQPGMTTLEMELVARTRWRILPMTLTAQCYLINDKPYLFIVQ